MTSALSTLSLRTSKTWLVAAAFTVGGMFLPQLCHLMPQGGLIFLPIYFFTLVAVMTCGWQVGLVVALATPAVNCAIFGMPAPQMLPIILMKGALLVAAAEGAKRLGGITLWTVALAVLAYQLVGCAIESIVAGDMAVGFQDMRLGIPGIIAQMTLGYLLIKAIAPKIS